MARGRGRLDPARVIPLFPDTPTASAPKEPPNLDSSEILAVDCETYDPRLEDMGPGFIRGDARLAGVSIATDDDSWYFPIGHRSGNCEWDATSWLQDELRKDRRYVFCNAHYDVEALWSIDAVPAGNWSDISISQALLNEEFKEGYGLDAISTFWTGKGKDETELLIAASSLGCRKAAEAKKVIALLDGGSVAQYARIDAERTLASYRCQAKELDVHGLDRVLELEENLLGLTWQMRLQGVRFDVTGAEMMRDDYLAHEKELTTMLWREAGMAISVWSVKDIARYCRQQGIIVPLTDSDNPSFKGDFLETSKNKTLQIIAEIRKYEKMRRDFIELWLEHAAKDNRVHPRWMQTMTEDGGTRSGRMASSDPNLQQVPVRDPIHGPRLRSLFLPESGQRWGKFDYQAQEIRIAVHFATKSLCRGVGGIVKRYRDDKHFDFHNFVAALAGIKRTPAKTLALGTLYGMAPAKIVSSLGLGEDFAQEVYDRYFEAAPYFKQLAYKASDRAKERGYVHTYLGRMRRFPKDSNTHKALNAVVQGTAADMLKQAMWNTYQELGKIPLVAVHDESGYSVQDDNEAKQIAEIMETALELEIPMLVEPSLTDNWNAKD